MIAPTVMRGSSDAYGSWKTICSSRRRLRISPWADLGELGAPCTGSIPTSARSAAARSARTVVLPEPDSPTRPSVSPASMANDTPDTACTSVLDRPQALQRLDGEVLDEVGDLEDGFSHATPAASSSTRTQAVSRSPNGRSSGMPTAHSSAA